MSDLQQLETYDQYLRRLDARALLEHYGAQRWSEQVNHHDGTVEIVHSCLIDRVHPHHANGDLHPSAACNIDKRKYVCYSLGWGGDLLHFIQLMEGKATPQEALPFAANFLSEAVLPVQQFQTELDRYFDTPAATEHLATYDESVLAPWSEGHPYWNQRGITYAAMEMLRLGYDPTTRRLVFPHFHQGQLVGWQKRAIPGESVSPEPKYLSSPGMPKSQTLYNLDMARTHPRVLVVESPMSVAKAVSLDIPNVLATFGAKVSLAQISLLASVGFEMIYIWFDRDAAGIAGERKLVQGLYRRTPVLVVTPDRDRDLGDCSAEEIAVKLKHAVPAARKLGEYDLYRKIHR
jgi:hypothetical protein